METTGIPSIKTPLSSATQKLENAAARNEAPLRKAAAGSTGKPLLLPEDVVNLSAASRSGDVQKPSIPVTSDEKSALLGSNNQQYGFSVYG